MPRLEFHIDDRLITVDFDDPSDAGTITQSIITGFDEMAKKKARVVRDVYIVPSQSNPRQVHPVAHFGNGIFECDCQGFIQRGYCRHMAIALEMHREQHKY